MTMPGRQFSAPPSSEGTEGGYRYGFNGKELDNSTAEGSYDFGARIYDSRIGRWLTVDPLQVKYPSIATYNFCLSNPILFVDPDGKVVKIYDHETGKLIAIVKADHKIVAQKGFENHIAIQQYKDAREYLKNDGKSNVISELESDEKTINLRITSKTIAQPTKDKKKVALVGALTKLATSKVQTGFQDSNGNNKQDEGEPTIARINSEEAATIYWNPNNGFIDNNNVGHSSALLLEHEFNHAYEFIKHLVRYLEEKKQSDPKSGNKHEKRVIDNVNNTAKNLETDGGGGNNPRSGHDGKPKSTTGVKDVPTVNSKDPSTNEKDVTVIK